MKKLKKFTALFLVLIYTIVATSCKASEKVLEKINAYLTEEYPERSFSVMDYTKRNETSGRYEVNAVCLDDDIEFQIYIYSTITATDSYAVERANMQMEQAIRKEIDLFYKDLSKKFSSIQWLNIYADNAEGYSFRYIDPNKDYKLSDLNNSDIYRVELAEGLTISEVGGAIYDFMDDFYKYTPYIIGKTTFVYTLNQVTYEFTTDAKTTNDLGKTGVVNLLLSNTVTSAEKNGKVIIQPVEFTFISETAEENQNANDIAQ